MTAQNLLRETLQERFDCGLVAARQSHDWTRRHAGDTLTRGDVCILLRSSRERLAKLLLDGILPKPRIFAARERWLLSRLLNPQPEVTRRPKPRFRPASSFHVAV